MRTYWLHIIENKSPQLGLPSTYMLALADAPERNITSGAMPTVHHHSWERLSERLSRVGVDESVLRAAKAGLDLTGNHTIPEVVLSNDQLRWLGYEDVAA
jgi:hypothetical protein